MLAPAMRLPYLTSYAQFTRISLPREYTDDKAFLPRPTYIARYISRLQAKLIGESFVPRFTFLQYKKAFHLKYKQRHLLLQVIHIFML